MVWLDMVAVLFALPLTVGTAIALWRHDRLLAAHALAQRAAAARLIELRYLGDRQRRLSEAQQLAENVIDTGATAVQSVHMGISRIPFGILEAIPVTRDTARIVRQTHDLISGTVYGSIRGINKAAGKVTRGALKAAQPPSASRGDDPPGPGPADPRED